MNERQALEEAIRLAGSQAKLAALVGGTCRQGHVSYWVKMGKVSPNYVLAVSECTGVSCNNLRPDLHRKEATA